MAKAGKVSVLFTGAGRRVELISAFRAAHDRLGLDGQILAVDVDPLAPALRVAHRAHFVPLSADDGYVPRLLSLCELHGVDLIFPVIDNDIPILAKAASAFESIGTRVAVMGVAGATTVSDKWATAQFLTRIAITAPTTWLPETFPEESPEMFPVFVKPRFGSASKHTGRVDTADELRSFLTHCPDPVIQQFLEGPEVTCDLAYSLDGQFLGLCERRRIETRAGEVQKGVTVWDPDIAQACLAIGKGLAARGPITIQCLFDRGQPVFTEINGRFGGGLPLAIAAGLDFPSWYLSMAAGLECSVPALGDYRQGLYMTRHDDSFFLTDLDAQDASRTSVERGPWHPLS
jgi:carbamoyl-phosphate synthase large subunit